MAHFDTSGLTATFTKPSNPLTMGLQAAQTKNLLLEGMRNQADYNAKKAQGDALAQATSSDGSIDYGRVRANYAANKDAHYGMGDAVTQSQQQEGTALTLSQAQNNAINGILSFAGTHPDREHLNAAGKMARAVLPPSMTDRVNRVIKSIQQHPDGIAGGIKQLVNSAQSPETQQQNTYGSSGATINNGSHILVGNQQSAMNGGQFKPATLVTQGLTPGQAATPITFRDNDGKDHTVSLQNFTKLFGDGHYGDEGITGPNPGNMAASEIVGQEAGKQFGNAMQNAGEFANNQYRDIKALHDLETLGIAGQGKPGIVNNRIIQAAEQMGMPVSKDRAATLDEANKYLVQRAMSRGVNSDMQLATALEANPSTKINNFAAQNVMRANIALDRRENAAYRKFMEKYPGQQAQSHASEWPAFKAQFTSSRDPRAYLSDILTPEQHTRMWNRMSRSDKIKYIQQHKEAQELGVSGE